MNINIRNYDPQKYGVKKFQEGGPIDGGEPVDQAPAEGAPAEGGDPMQQLLMAAQQALESQDCNLAMQVCQALMQMAGAEQQAPAEPVYRRGGVLAYRLK